MENENIKSLETEKLKKEYEALIRENKELIDIIKLNVKMSDLIKKELISYKKFAFINSIAFMILASFLIFFFMNIASR